MYVCIIYIFFYRDPIPRAICDLISAQWWASHSLVGTPRYSHPDPGLLGVPDQGVKRVVELDGKFSNRAKGKDKPDKAGTAFPENEVYRGVCSNHICDAWLSRTERPEKRGPRISEVRGITSWTFETL